MEDDQVAADRVADYQLADDPAPIAGPSDELSTEWFSLDDEFESPAAPALPRRHHHVTAVLVSHDGAVWLPAALTTLAGQSRPPDAVVGVDTGSTDGSLGQLRSAFGADRVVAGDSHLGFGDAVRAGVAQVGQVQVAPSDDPVEELVEWLWLLHDDSAADPSCLQALLNTADDFPSASILGPKILGWHDRRLLLEVGVSITSSGRRYTGLERREHDQGQHDGVRDVLAVSSAGMLVRREAWQHLDGFDRALPLFRDDIDFCWRAHLAGERVLIATDAVLHHREAAAHGRRADDLAPRPHRIDREAAVHVLLAHTSVFAGPFLALRLLIVSAVRSIVYLLGKDFDAARDEVGAVLDVALHPGRLHASRRLSAKTATEPYSVIRSLRPSIWAQARQGLELVAGIATTSSSALSASVSAIDSGPIDDDAAYLDSAGPGLIRRLLVRPSVIFIAVMSVFALVAMRTLWWGEGVLQGGALLPSMPGAGDLWGSYSEAWHNIGPGSVAPAAPYLMLIFGLAFLLLGKAQLAVTVIFVLGVPLAAWSMYFATRGLVTGRAVRIWAGAAYALVPALTGALSSGRIGTVMAAILLPFVVRSFVRIIGVRGTFRRAAGTALLLAALIAVLPFTWLIALAFAIAFSVPLMLQKGKAAWPVVRRLTLAVVASIALLLPWSMDLLRHPAEFFLQPGVESAALSDTTVNAIDVFLLHPGGPGMTPLWVTLGILIAGFSALLRRERASYILACWALGGSALLIGVLQTLVFLTPTDSITAIRTWPGGATLVFSAAMILAASIATDGLRERMVGVSFNIGQPFIVFVVVLAVFAPVLSAIYWFSAADGQLRKAPLAAVPAFVEADALGGQAPRTLVLRQDRDGAVQYTLVNGAGPSLGAADAGPPGSVWAAIDPLVAGLASGRGGDEVSGLAGYGVRYVLLAAGTSKSLIPVLDGEPGLRRLSSSSGEVLWRIAGVTSRARLVDGETSSALDVVAAPAGAAWVGIDPYLDQLIAAGPGGREIVVGAVTEPNWRATVVGPDGTVQQDLQAQPPTGQLSWSQGFTAPANSAQVVISFDQGERSLWLWLQFILLFVLVVLALPARQPSDPDPDEDSVEDLGAESGAAANSAPKPASGPDYRSVTTSNVVIR
ncbi:integral membrane regulatory protein [Actinomycetes bacterium]|nr:integral membrane regulatory protein [Actinomycetes bacterium]